MESFDSIFQRAAERMGGDAELEALLPQAASKARLSRLRDASVLAEMTKCVFRSGFVWKVIENKWPGFEAAFDQFDVTACAMLSDEDLDTLLDCSEELADIGIEIRWPAEIVAPR